MAERDFYEVLGVQRGATDEEIKRAYRKLAQEHHPDKHRGEKHAEERFKEINQAYDVLKDPEKRARYDRFGYVGASGAGFRDSGFADAGFGDFQEIFSDVFGDFFGGQRRQAGPERGADLRYDLNISFNEAAFGSEKAIEVPRIARCGSCSGSGAKPGTQPSRCDRCSGTGQQRLQQGFFTISRPCGACHGRGTVIKTPCQSCSGSGRTRETHKLTVKIPPGVDTGSRLRVMGEGSDGERGGPKGDLYVVMNVEPHPIFERQDDDIICEIPIAFAQAALGAEIEVPTLEGTTKLKIPAGTQSGKVFRLSNKGIASVHTGRRGDQHVVVKVETPTKLTKRQRELLEEFAEISGDETMPLKTSFFDKVKEIFE
jgi:molecular chaperone DnaJ